MTAEVRFVKPKINKDLLGQEKTVHANQTMRLAIEFTGAPKPDISIHLPNGDSVTSDPARYRKGVTVPEVS